ncbi:MAG: mannose-1-phosphate guanylyltransferase/mannose-6-phosphate isomerase [Methanomicrobiales archaeon HGW-Methanomicrobiales-4]|nr:MAG: mannose-1-phosphate guanylyltransferase/mannose-6-phosphate isomerase [Methanomicrobiales archaeon HGW-Methanomicrobiales-4]
MSSIYSVILAGGVGTRLWPLSRTHYPKQFLQMNGYSLFQETYLRALALSEPEDILVVTNEIHHFLVIDQITELGHTIEESRLLKEPEGRNTLPAITWAVRVIGKTDPAAIVVVFPSDHMLGHEAIEEIRGASELGSENLVTFGIRPASAHTGYGYIAPGEKVGSGFRVREFREKPDLKTAEEYVRNGYLWNSGMFLFTVQVFEKELRQYQPAIADAFDSADLVYNTLPSLSIDYGLLELSHRVTTVPLTAHWTDLGTFAAWYDVAEKDSHGNVGVYEGIDASGNFISTGSRVTAVIGVENTIIVDTDDALLVCRRDMAEQVGDLVKKLKKKGNPITEFHREVFRPWGSYTQLEETTGYKIKRLNVNPGKRLSLQRHHHRSEHWVIVRGTADVELNGTHEFLRPGESTYVSAGTMHRLGNSGKIPLEVIEVQIGEYLEEDDIERTADDFKRV